MNAEVSEITLSSQGIELFGRMTDIGSPARTVLLLLPGVGFHSFEYREMAKLLAAAGLPSLALDYRGHGRSGGPRGSWLLDDLAADAHAAIDWLERRGHRLVVVFGNSLGGMIAIKLAKRDGRVGAVVASNCPAHVADFLLTPMRRFLLTVAVATAPFVPLRISLNRFYSYDQLISDRGQVRAIEADPAIAEARRLSAKAFATLVNDWDGEAELRGLNVPLLLVQGLRDELQPASQTDLLFAAASEPKARVVLDTGHLPNLERPDLLVDCIVEWLKSLNMADA